MHEGTRMDRAIGANENCLGSVGVMTLSEDGCSDRKCLKNRCFSRQIPVLNDGENFGGRDAWK